MNAIISLLSPSITQRILNVTEHHEIETLCNELEVEFQNNPIFQHHLSQLMDENVCGKDLEEAQKLKTQGNSSFKENEFLDAINFYTKALQYCPFTNKENTFLSQIFTNRALCLQKLNYLVEAENDCNYAIEFDESYSKAWYRRGRVRVALGAQNLAIEDLKRVLFLEQSTGCSSVTVEKIQHELKILEEKKREFASPKNSTRSQKNLARSPKSLVSTQESLVRTPENLVRTPESLVRAPVNDESRTESRSEPQSYVMPPKSSFVPHVRDGLEVFCDSESGRQIIASENFFAGETVLKEQPYAAILLKSNRFTNCHYCFSQLNLNSFPCENCTNALYCSRECQNSATWQIPVKEKSGTLGNIFDPSQHGVECGGMSWSFVLPVENILAGRILVKMFFSNLKNGLFSENNLKNGQFLETNLKNFVPNKCLKNSKVRSNISEKFIQIKMEKNKKNEENGDCEKNDMEKNNSENNYICPLKFFDDFEISNLCYFLDKIGQENKIFYFMSSFVISQCLILSVLKNFKSKLDFDFFSFLTQNLNANYEKKTFEFNEKNKNEILNELYLKLKKEINTFSFLKILCILKVNAIGVNKMNEIIKDENFLNFGIHSKSKSKSKSEVFMQDTISEISQIPIAQSLYIRSSLFNHSCSPNAFLSFSNRNIRVRTTQNVPLGSQLTISYGVQKGLKSTPARRKWLKERYFFECRCQTCQEFDGFKISDFKNFQTKIYSKITNPDPNSKLFSNPYDLNCAPFSNFSISRASENVKFSKNWELFKTFEFSEMFMHGLKCLNRSCGFGMVPNLQLICNSEGIFEISETLETNFEIFGKCLSCEHPWDGKKSNQILITLSSQFTQLKTYFLNQLSITNDDDDDDDNDDEKKNEMKSILSRMKTIVDEISLYLHPLNIDLAKFEDILAHFFCILNNFEEAFLHSYISTKILEFHLRLDCIELANERQKLVSIAQVVGQNELAKSLLHLILPVFQCHYGIEKQK